ncbi:MAG: DUF2974 domain-containing protein [Lachnospiraceae bacterium]|nr:DUF2974 domain-containing protein [Lachnospiraceae bacterium]
MSYLKMSGIVPGFGQSSGVGWREMAEHPEAEKMFADPLYGKQHRRVFGLVARSRRYRQIKANFYKEWFDEKREIQFAAVTFFLGETSIFVSFRGTDETLVGWKEDFNMGYMKEIPSQRSALAYLKGVARYTGGRMILGGHSKGGNLAIYAAACAAPQVQRRIRRVYSFDGPGFQKGFYERPGFIRIEERFCKIVPEQSLVGMILANYKKYRVVESYGSGMVQHDLMQWKIREGRFVYRRELQGRSTRKSAILNAWVNSLTKRQITEFVEILYELLRSTQASTVAELVKRPFRILYLVLRSFGRMDKKRRQSFLQIIGKLFAAAGAYLRGIHRPGFRSKTKDH